MKLEVSKDDNNFIIKVTEVNLNEMQYLNYKACIKKDLSKKYGKASMMFVFDEKLTHSSFNVTIPNGYYDDLEQIEFILNSAYSSMRKSI